MAHSVYLNMEKVMDLIGPAVPLHPLEGIPLRLWRAVSLAPHRLLMLDHDGTLALLQAVREDAVPPRRTLELVERIAASAGTAVAIVSGRPVQELSALLGPLPVTLVGEHGWESCEMSGRVLRFALPEGAALQLEHAEELARQAGLEPYLERKRSSLAVHTRSLARSVADQVEAAVARVWDPGHVGRKLRLVRFDGGLELRLLGHDKGSAVAQLLEREGPGTLAVYLGDDLTDEDAFEAVRDRGFGVRVGAPDRPTLATGWLAGPGEVADFLEEWLRISAEAPSRQA